MIKTPKFWLKKHLISYFLLPFSALYLALFYVIKFSSKRTKISKSVICIGNIIAGGSGKTPTALAIGDMLSDLGIHFAYLSRGYKRKDKKNAIFLRKGQKIDAKISGDEPALLSQNSDVFISQNKLQTLKDIDEKTDYDVVVLDDGLQNNVIFSDLRIVVVDAKIGFGNKLPLPAGPLREPIESGLKKADLVIIIGNNHDHLSIDVDENKIIHAGVAIVNLDQFKNEKLMAFCGIAYPDKFFDLLKKNGLDVVKERSFVDHYAYKDADLDHLMKIATKNNAKLVTTKKDWVKFSKKYQSKIDYLDIKLEFNNKDRIISEIKKLI